MTRQEFEQLRNLPGKLIQENIEFMQVKEMTPNLVFYNVPVLNDQNWDIRVNGTYKPGIPSITFNFALYGSGPICRLCINGTIHGNAGRTHKHELRTEDDPRYNLPTALPKPEMETLTARQAWNWLCENANIIHEGEFIDPA